MGKAGCEGLQVVPEPPDPGPLPYKWQGVDVVALLPWGWEMGTLRS